MLPLPQAKTSRIRGTEQRATGSRAAPQSRIRPAATTAALRSRSERWSLCNSSALHRPKGRWWGGRRQLADSERPGGWPAHPLTGSNHNHSGPFAGPEQHGWAATLPDQQGQRDGAGLPQLHPETTMLCADSCIGRCGAEAQPERSLRSIL